MNAPEHFFCSSAFWRYFSERKLLPWVLAAHSLGEHALEIGAGYGASTRFLRGRARRVTALEYNREEILKWKARCDGDGVAAVCGDGAHLPFAAQSFSAVVAILVLHHLKSAELQDQMLSEAMRVLRPGGVLMGFEIQDSWLNRVIHKGSTFTPFTSDGAYGRLAAARFAQVGVDVRSGAFRFSAARAG